MKTLLLTAGVMIASVMSVFSQNAVKPETTGYADVNGLDMYYEIYGEGKPVVLLHGAYMTINLNWARIIPKLSETRKVVAVEMQGHGHTADIERPLDYKALASDIAALLKHLKIDKADIIGYSFGGTVALKTGIDYPKRVDKMVIISTAYKSEGWMPAARETFLSMDPGFLDNTPLKTQYDKIAPDPGHWTAFVEKFIAFDKKNYDLGAENIGNLKSPVLFIMGDNDGVDPGHIIDMYKLCGGSVFGDVEGLPESQLAILPGKTHVGLMMDTEHILSFITPFLDKAPAQNASIQH
ncbi:alpha/beta hydrolase [Sinomicrobium kalidii]|uniref:alpha/beta fold hydrolase n=1 Tax=Sinomicrobium kalidii TaxID=2900738 RepID=UPI001E297744|nr:alpha/beta hydrolase [Sinomicrobium kalidii]UGU15524.1 alpha/beta hydrolase [Sinomicrobium kalidii]